MASRACLVAVNRTIRAGGLEEDGPHAALIDMARNLARRMDRVGPDEAPLNLLRMYDSAVTKLERAVAPKLAAKPRRDEAEPDAAADPAPAGPPALKIVEESPLDRIRNAKSRRAG